MNCHDDEKSNFILYADDTNIFIKGKTKEEAFCRANIVLDNLHTYMKFNLLHINMEKCCCMHFEPNKLPDNNNCYRTLPFVSK